MTALAWAAQVIGWTVLAGMGFVALVLACAALDRAASGLEDWRERRRYVDRKIRHLAYEGELILASERARERAS